MRPELQVREATPQDLASVGPRLAALPLLQSYGQTADGLDRALRAALDAGDRLLVAQDADKVPLGLAWFTLRGGLGLAAYLRLLGVVPEAHGRGVGAALLHAFERLSQDARGGQLVLCNAKNAAALGFYRAQGYAQVGLLRGFARAEHDEVLLHRPRATL